MHEDDMGKGRDSIGWSTPSRREFLTTLMAVGIAGQTCRGWAASESGSATSRLPAEPNQPPLDFHALAEAFDEYIFDPAHGVALRDKQGRQVFASALESATDGGLTTYAPIALGRELRGKSLEEVAKSLGAYYNEEYGLFLDGEDATLCEYWYLMNVNAMALSLVQLRFADDPVWQSRVERCANRLQRMAQQIHYDFNSQGYDFAKGAVFTQKDIYRQPDAVGGYSYVMLMAWKITGKKICLDEARIAMEHYLRFSTNPWYEIPSGAMATLAAAELETLGYHVDTGKALSFVLDAKVGLMATGQWGGREVNGLMAGFRTEPAGQVYSMESMVTLPYLLPAVRLRPDLAGEIASYALHVTANLRWFYPDYLPHENQSRPDLPPMVPYERLSREEKGHSPYATGDFAGHRSVYGGAYVLWLDRMLQPQGDPWIQRWDLTATNFLDRSLPPTFLYYNPLDVTKQIRLDGVRGLHDLTHRRALAAHGGTVEFTLAPGEARVVQLEK